MNIETKRILADYFLDKSINEELDEIELMDSYEEMEDQVLGIFEDWENEEWEAADNKILRIREAYG